MAESLARTEILRRRREVARVRRLGAKTGTRFLSLRCAPRPEDNSRTGFGNSPLAGTVPVRRVAFLLPRGVGDAVERNRLKRRLREIYRRNKDWFAAGYDFLIQPTVSAGRLSFDGLLEQMRLAARTKSEVPNRDQPQIAQMPQILPARTPEPRDLRTPEDDGEIA